MIEADHDPPIAGPAAPAERRRGLDGDPGGDRRRQDALTPGGVLCGEQLPRWHRDNAGRHAAGGQGPGGGDGDLHLAAGGDDDGRRASRGLDQNVRAAGRLAHAIGLANLCRERLAGEDECGRPVRPVHGGAPRLDRFGGIGGSQRHHARDGAQHRQLLDRLVGRTVFAESDGVMGEDVGHREPHQCRQAHRRLAVVEEDEERRAIRAESAVHGDAVERRRHAVFANAPVHSRAGGVRVEDLADLDVRAVAAAEISRTAHQRGDRPGDGGERLLGCLARGERIGREVGEPGIPARGKFTGDPGPEDGRVGMPGEAGSPGRLERIALRRQRPHLRVRLRGDVEGFRWPVQDRLGPGDLLGPEWCAVGRGGVLLGRCRRADDRPEANQRRLRRLRRGVGEGGVDRLEVVAVIDMQHAPAEGAVALLDIIGERDLGVAVDGDVVVVVHHGQLAELQVAGERGGLIADTLHHVAVRGEDPGPVIDQVAAELPRQEALGDGHADGVAEPLAQRAGGGLDADGVAVFGVPRGLRTPLAEVADVVEREVVARQVEQGVQQQRRVAAGEHEPVAIRPVGVSRRVFQVASPEHVPRRGKRHRGAGMPRIGRLDGIHREHANRVDDLPGRGRIDRGVWIGSGGHWSRAVEAVVGAEGRYRDNGARTMCGAAGRVPYV